jgi:hypothetical protein
MRSGMALGVYSVFSSIDIRRGSAALNDRQTG